MPDEDLFDILARVQGTRLNDQRTSVMKNQNNSNPQQQQQQTNSQKYVTEELPNFTSK